MKPTSSMDPRDLENYLNSLPEDDKQDAIEADDNELFRKYAQEGSNDHLKILFKNADVKRKPVLLHCGLKSCLNVLTDPIDEEKHLNAFLGLRKVIELDQKIAISLLRNMRTRLFLTPETPAERYVRNLDLYDDEKNIILPPHPTNINGELEEGQSPQEKDSDIPYEFSGSSISKTAEAEAKRELEGSPKSSTSSVKANAAASLSNSPKSLS